MSVKILLIGCQFLELLGTHAVRIHVIARLVQKMSISVTNK